MIERESKKGVQEGQNETQSHSLKQEIASHGEPIIKGKGMKAHATKYAPVPDGENDAALGEAFNALHNTFYFGSSCDDPHAASLAGNSAVQILGAVDFFE